MFRNVSWHQQNIFKEIQMQTLTGVVATLSPISICHSSCKFHISVMSIDKVVLIRFEHHSIILNFSLRTFDIFAIKYNSIYILYNHILMTWIDTWISCTEQLSHQMIWGSVYWIFFCLKLQILIVVPFIVASIYKYLITIVLIMYNRGMIFIHYLLYDNYLLKE